MATRRWKLGIDDKPASATNATGWGTLDQPQGEHHDGSSGETGDDAEEMEGEGASHIKDQPRFTKVPSFTKTRKPPNPVAPPK